LQRAVVGARQRVLAGIEAIAALCTMAAMAYFSEALGFGTGPAPQSAAQGAGGQRPLRPGHATAPVIGHWPSRTHRRMFWRACSTVITTPTT